MADKKFIVMLGSLNWDLDEGDVDKFDYDDIEKYGEFSGVEIIVKNYNKEDWTPRVQWHHVKLEQIVIDLFKDSGLNVYSYHHEKDNLCKTIFKALRNDSNDLSLNCGSFLNVREWNGEEHYRLESYEVRHKYDEEIKQYINKTKELTVG